MMYFDSYYFLLVVPAMLFAFWAQINVTSTFKKYSGSTNLAGITGYDAARMILDGNGLSSVKIEQVSGELTDHYDPKSNVIRLSDSVYSSRSTASVGVAAHEAGHAVQHATGYVGIKIRTAILPVCSIGSKVALPLFIIGLLIGYMGLAMLGVWAFGLATLFQLVTLPVEFNASKRALASLDESGRFSDKEVGECKKVLTAAALTYVAALATSLASFLRLLLIVRGNRRR